jgi:large subunit ribosomal protein L17
MLRNLASSLFLTERDADPDLEANAPKVKGRVITTLHKAKEVRPLVEKCVTIARNSLQAEEEAEQYATTAEHGTDAWKQWRTSEQWQKWNHAISPAVAARRRVVELIGNKEATRVLFDEIAPRFEDRDGGYTRILRVAQPRVGDSGQQAILEFVGVHDREKQVSEKPAFETDEDLMDESDDTDQEVSEEPSQEQGADSATDDEPAELQDDTREPEAEVSGDEDGSKKEDAPKE